MGRISPARGKSRSKGLETSATAIYTTVAGGGGIGMVEEREMVVPGGTCIPSYRLLRTYVLFISIPARYPPELAS